MFAVLETGGKQYRVEPGNIIKVEKLEGEVGSKITLDKILIANNAVGIPFLSNASVIAEVVDQCKSEKDIIFKKKRRHNYRRKRGHRQQITVLRIQEINS